MFTIFCFFGLWVSNAQTVQDADFLISLQSKPKSGVLLQSHARKSVSSVVLYPFYYVYKQFISSQDGSACSFYPSCANYGLLAVQKKGILGVFLAFDRVSRCHGIYPHVYPQHVSGLNWDAL